jgi:hypothetical protein
VIDRFTSAAARVACAALGLGLACALIAGATSIVFPEVRVWFGAGGLWITLAAAALGLGLGRLGWPPGRMLLAVPARTFAALAFAIALASGAWAHFAIQKGVPDVPDEMSYLHQARGFADGQLAPPSPPLEEFHYTSWAIHDGGRWYSVFPPGYGVLLAAGVEVGVPWLVNPLLGALLALALFALGRTLFGGDGLAARVAVLVYLASWFRLMHAGSFMAHPTAALATVLVVLRGVTGGGSRAYGALAGAALAFLLATRPLNAVLLSLVLLPVIVRALALQTHAWRKLVPLTLAALPLVVLYGAYNRALTGSPLYAPQQRYMQLREEVGDCFRLGFGPGVGQCPITQNTNFGPRGFQPKDALANTQRRIDAYLRYSFAFSPLVILPGLGALAGALGSAAAARRRGLAAALVLAAVGGYGLFFYHGVAYGARFYYETFPFIALLAAAGLEDLGRRLAPRWRAVLGTVFGALLVTGLVAAWPAIDKQAGQRGRTQDGTLIRALEAPALHDAVVFVDSLVLPAAMTRHPGAIDENHPIVVRDFGDAADAGYLRLHPRPAFRLVGARALPLSLPADAPVRSEGGALYPLEVASGGFGDRVPAAEVWKLPLSDGQALRFRSRERGARFAWKTFVPVADAGPLTLHVEVAGHPQSPAFTVSVDDAPVSGRLDAVRPQPALFGVDLPVTLSTGSHWIAITLDDPGAFYLDHAELARRPAP